MSSEEFNEKKNLIEFAFLARVDLHKFIGQCHIETLIYLSLVQRLRFHCEHWWFTN